MYHKKILLAFWIFVVFVLVYCAFIYFYNLKYTNEMHGVVTEISDGNITVKGYLNNLTDEEKELVTVKLITNGKTLFKKESVLIDREKNKPGEVFEPEIIIREGKFSDIKIQTDISLVRTKGNLYKKDSGEAKEIIYSIIEFKK